MTVVAEHSDWPLVRLGDLVNIRHGYAFSGKHFTDRQTSDVLLTPGNFAIGGGFKLDKFKYYSGPVPNDYVLKPGDLLVTMTDLSKQSDTLGFPAIVPRSRRYRFLHNQRLGLVLKKPSTDLHLGFLYYLLCSNSYRHEIVAGATGTTVKHTSPTRILQFQFHLPPAPLQERIADILGSLDDKIELNRRMNETLEVMARRLFKSWFVDFDPVHAKARLRRQHPDWSNERLCREALPNLDPKIAELFPDEFDDSTLGRIPKEWKATTVPDAIEVNPPRSLPKGVEAAWLEMANMPTRSARALAWERRAFGSGTKFKNGDTLVARITPCLENGKTAYVDFLAAGEIGAGSTEYIVLCAKTPLPPEFGYFLARNHDFRQHLITNMTGTSGRQRAPADCLNTYPIVVPSRGTAERFGEFASMVLSQMKQNDEQSRSLVAARDRLLPVLLSGHLPLNGAAFSTGKLQ